MSLSLHRVVSQSVDGEDAVNTVDGLTVSTESVLQRLGLRSGVEVLDGDTALNGSRRPTWSDQPPA
jgi:hypothetical protein